MGKKLKMEKKLESKIREKLSPKLEEAAPDFDSRFGEDRSHCSFPL